MERKRKADPMTRVQIIDAIERLAADAEKIDEPGITTILTGVAAVLLDDEQMEVALCRIVRALSEARMFGYTSAQVHEAIKAITEGHAEEHDE